MFDNLLTAIKNQTNSLSDNFKSKTRKLTFSVTSLKGKITNKPKTTYAVNQKEDYDYFYNDYLSPRAYYVNDNWPSMNDNMQWVPYVPPKLDEHNIVDRFIKVITLDDENDVRMILTGLVFYCFLFAFSCFRDVQIAKKYVEDWLWVLKMITTMAMKGLVGNRVYKQDYKVVSFRT